MYLFRTPMIYWAMMALLGACVTARGAEDRISVRVAAYNVMFGKHASPEQIGEMFRPYNLDIIGFNEVPDGDWTERVGRMLNMPHNVVGKIASANHRNKYKSILSRTPIIEMDEHLLEGRGWNPASVVRAVTLIEGQSVAVYSLHISASGKTGGHAHFLASEILSKEEIKRVVVLGDFNNKIGDAPIIAMEDAGMRPIWRDLDLELLTLSTWNAIDPTKNGGVIDHIFYNRSSHARATQGGIIELAKPLSDHKPVWAEIAFPHPEGHR